MPQILLVEDDVLFSDLLERYLLKKGFEVVACSTGAQAEKNFNELKIDLVLLDHRLPDTTGIELLQKWKNSHSELPVILMTAYSDIRLAIEAIKMGAFDYIIKPIQQEELLHSIQQALKSKPAFSPKNGESNQPNKIHHFVAGNSAKAREVQEMLSLVASTPISVILMGESGTGKEYAARYIHEHSKRANQRFAAVDCGALTEELAASELFGHIKGSFTGALTDKTGVFEYANGGTLFLDEIGNLSYEIQVMLLRVLQEKQLRRIGDQKLRPVDVRIIVATNEDLRMAVQNGSFREDLYHRLNEFSIQLPPLRDRQSDIELFMQHFLQQANDELEKEVLDFSASTIAIFKQYNWPGNLREFKNIIKRCVLLTAGKTIESQVLPDEIRNFNQNNHYSMPNTPGNDLHSRVEAQEEVLIREVLEKVRFNKSKAALMLNIDRKTLYAKLKKYGID